MGKGSVLGWGSLLSFIFLLYIKRSGSMLFAVFLMEKGNKEINKKITICFEEKILFIPFVKNFWEASILMKHYRFPGYHFMKKNVT